MPAGWDWLIIAAVLLLLFGAKKLPEMARSIGQSARVFKGEMKGMKADDQPASAGDQAAPQPPPALPPAQVQAQPEPNPSGRPERSA